MTVAVASCLYFASFSIFIFIPLSDYFSFPRISDLLTRSVSVVIRKHVDSFILSHIPVTDIAQPCGVNAMKVSER